MAPEDAVASELDDGHRTTVGTSGLVSLAEQVSAQQREEQACVAFHTNMRGFRAHFPPRNGFAQSSTGKASIMFGGRGDVNGTVKTAPVLIPPDDVMLGNPAANHQGIGDFNVPRQIAHDLLVGQGVKVEITVLLAEHEQLRADGPVRDARNANRNLVFGGPVNERVRGADALPQFPDEVNGAKTNPRIGPCLLYTSPSPRDFG